MIVRVLVTAIYCAFAGLIAAAEYVVKSTAELSVLKPKPGDVVILADGTWVNQSVVFKGKGTAERPIAFRAQTPGRVIFTGKSSLTLDGEHLVVSGFWLKASTDTGGGITLKGSCNRVTECAVTDGTHSGFVNFLGKSNRLDHSYFAGKTTVGATLQLVVEKQPNYHRIDHNHFGPRPPLGKNGGETMRIGNSTTSMSNSRALVEYNLFDRCDGEIEIISNKSCENTYRANTFLDCNGMLTLRHGNRCIIDGNFFFGHRKSGSGGVRVIGEDHVVINNYFDDLTRGIWITSGVPNSELHEYFQARNCLIAFNTMVNSRGPAIEVDAGYGSSKRTLRPESITIANNVFAMPKGEALLQGEEGKGFKWLGNVLAGTDNPAKHPGFKRTDAALKAGADQITRPTGAIPAEGDFPNVKTDLEGRERGSQPQAGAIQFSEVPATVVPMTTATAGPAWMTRTAGMQKK